MQKISGEDKAGLDMSSWRLSLAARTAQSYFELSEANLQVLVAEQSVKDRRAIVELARGRFSRGLRAVGRCAQSGATHCA